MHFCIILARKWLYEQGYGSRIFKFKGYWDDIVDVIKQLFPSINSEIEEDYACSVMINIYDSSLAYLYQSDKENKKLENLLNAIEGLPDESLADMVSVKFHLAPHGAVLKINMEETWFPWTLVKELHNLKQYAVEVMPWTQTSK